MLKGENIICISSIDWNFVWQGHQEAMSTFARNGNRVLFIENTGVRGPRIGDISRIKDRIKNWFKGVKGIRKEIDNLYVFSPLVLPFPYSRIARWINCHLLLPVLERWMEVMDFNDPIIWTFLPTGLSLDLISNIDNKLVVYYCIADFEKLVPNPHKIRDTERRVIQKSDLIFAQGETLKKRCEEYNTNVSIFPFGVNIDVFNKDHCPRLRPRDISSINGELLGYIGGIHRHLDFELIRFLAERNPGWTFVLIGPVQAEISKIRDLQNVVFLELKKHKELAGYIDSFKVCLIPYELNEYTETVYPTKLNEYLAMGKAVISTAIPEVVSFNEKSGNVIYIGRDREEFESHIKKAIKEDDALLRSKRIEVAQRNSWRRRIEDMSGLIEDEIERKKSDREAMWKENLVNFYRSARRRVLRLSLICISIYLLLFKTLFIWFLASPLKISEIPQKTDAIVVFGGGVGETGSPGKSTIERARYAAELYLKGYAERIIFSSGYTYFYNDAANMKLLALSMGVPESGIILEQEANSTYENVIFSKEILGRHKWRSIILVSSPYNMRRSSLVFNRSGENIKVFYVPVEKSEFYDKSAGVKLAQIKAIIHEYLAILYYAIKGYI